MYTHILEYYICTYVKLFDNLSFVKTPRYLMLNQKNCKYLGVFEKLTVHSSMYEVQNT